MAEFGDIVLDLLSKRETVESLELSEELSVDHQKIVGAIKSLQSLGEVIECEQTSSARLQLTAEGEQIAKYGSHEAVIFNNIPPEGIVKEELFSKVGSANAKVGFSKAMAFKWITMDKKADGEPLVFRKVDKIEDLVQKICQSVQEKKVITKEQREDCKRRKLVEESTIVSYIVRRGPQFSTNIEKLETELTEEMIASGSCKTKKFKKYNINAKGAPIVGGHLNPLLKVKSQFRQIFLEMGFSEMPTNNYVESSFWNFDALFQPQQHPARDAHDTFFLSDPAEAKSFPMDYLERVKTVHSVGGYGSQGHKCDWKLKEASKNIMRTHTTGVSARMLYQIATKPTFEPCKLFSIDRVFRNETLDATHLAEFHQVEGVVADYGLTLGDLMGYIEVFFKKYGVEKLKFKPAFNPYTEPSMEIFSYHEGLKKWVEIGNSGMFRPEMLLPMGLPKDVNVLGWGLSLERPTMIKYKVQNIRELFGHKIDLQKVYDGPICRLGESGESLKLMTNFPEHASESSNQPLSGLLLLDKRIERVLDKLRRLSCRVSDHIHSLATVLPSQQPLATNCQLAKSPQASAQASCLSKCPVSTTSFVPNVDLKKDLKNLASGPTQISFKSCSLQTQSYGIISDQIQAMPVKYSGGKGKDIVINCDPSNPPVSLFILLDALSSLRSFRLVTLVHSSLKMSREKVEELKRAFRTSDLDVVSPDESDMQRVTVIWKDLGGFTNSSMSVGLSMNVLGEKSIAKYMFHLIEAAMARNNTKPVFPGGIQNPKDTIQLAVAEDIIDSCETNDIVTKLQSTLKTSSGPLLFGASVSLADTISWSRLVQSGGCNTTAEIKRWSNYCSQLPHFTAAGKMLEMCPKK